MEEMEKVEEMEEMEMDVMEEAMGSSKKQNIDAPTRFCGCPGLRQPKFTPRATLDASEAKYGLH